MGGGGWLQVGAPGVAPVRWGLGWGEGRGARMGGLVRLGASLGWGRVAVNQRAGLSRAVGLWPRP